MNQTDKTKVMKKLYIILGILPGSEGRSLKVVEAVNSEIKVVLDTYLYKGDNIHDYTTGNIRNFVKVSLELSSSVELINL